MTDAIFYVLAGLILTSAMSMVQARNLFHAGLALITCFLGVAGLYVLLNAPFIAALQVLIYAGAIAVILLFGFMLTHHVMRDESNKRFSQQAAGMGAAAVMCGVLVAVIGASPWKTGPAPTHIDDLNQLGQQLLTSYLLPFELASVFLLAALVGAIMIARKEEGPPPA